MKIYGPGFITTTSAGLWSSTTTEGGASGGPTTSYEYVRIPPGTTVHDAAIIYTAGSMVGSLGHTLMRFSIQRPGETESEDVYYSYGLNLLAAYRLEGEVIGADRSLFFSADENGPPSVYGDADYHELRLRTTESQRSGLLESWLRLHQSTPRYSFAFTNCASVIVHMIFAQFGWRARYRPHRFGYEYPYDVIPRNFFSALRVEYLDYSHYESMVSSYFEFVAVRGVYVRRSQERRWRPRPRGFRPPTFTSPPRAPRSRRY